MSLPLPTRPHNNFDAVRIAAALAVIVGHSFELVGIEPIPRVLNVPLHSIGVFVFFAMSGYLISSSWLRRPVLGDYLRNRTLRIMPGLIVVTVASFAVLGPVMSSLSVADYLENPRSWRYLLNIVLRPVFDLPGVFEDNPYAGSVNGSLWTLPIEFVCYLVFPLLLALGRARVFALVAFIVGAVLVERLVADPLVFWGSSFQRAANLAVFFALGSLVAVAGRRLRLRLDVAVVLLAFQAVFSAMASPATTQWTLWPVLTYSVLAFCTHSTPVIRRAARFGDLSYGLYIYAFPVQQVVVAVLPPLGFVGNLVVVTLTTTVLAWLSWHLVEKHALRLKATSNRSRATAVAAAPADGVAPTPR
ncbi:acyltransferase family protein [Labedella endophytica]|uniref:acyltransferase family protein n=1 Tax=Labedella endophytica TaxID=1523160 RepID=UPI00140E903A|nr:acyltransferase [Labedella endophytica]